MAHETVSSVTRSLGFGVAVVAAFLVVLEAARTVSFGPDFVGNNPVAVAVGVVVLVTFAIVWIATDSAFES